MKLKIDSDLNLNKYIRSVEKNFPGVISTEIKTTSIYANRLIVKSTPVKTGNLRSKWVRKSRGLSAKISNSTKYAKFLETGTGLFGPKKRKIKPKKGKYLFIPKVKGNTLIGGSLVREVSGVRKIGMISTNIKKITRHLTKGLQKSIRKLWEHDIK